MDLVSNLAGEQQQNLHSDAWSDLAAAGERQRVAGQLVSGLEAACVLLAGALQQSGSGSMTDASSDAEDFHKITDSVYVSIQTFGLEPKQQLANGSPVSYAQKFQVTFPSQANVLGTRWMNSDQKFTLNLQATNTPEVNQQTGKSSFKILSKCVFFRSSHLQAPCLYKELDSCLFFLVWFYLTKVRLRVASFDHKTNKALPLVSTCLYYETVVSLEANAGGMPLKWDSN